MKLGSFRSVSEADRETTSLKQSGPGACGQMPDQLAWTSSEAPCFSHIRTGCLSKCN